MPRMHIQLVHKCLNQIVLCNWTFHILTKYFDLGIFHKTEANLFKVIETWYLINSTPPKLHITSWKIKLENEDQRSADLLILAIHNNKYNQKFPHIYVMTKWMANNYFLSYHKYVEASGYTCYYQALCLNRYIFSYSFWESVFKIHVHIWKIIVSNTWKHDLLVVHGKETDGKYQLPGNTSHLWKKQ